MKSSGAVGVSIIIVSFLAVALLSSVNITQIDNGKTEYQFITDDFIESDAVNLSEYKDYIIPRNKENKEPQHVTLFRSGHLVHLKEASLSNSEITPLKTILNSLNYSKDCTFITVNFNLKTETWDKHSVIYPLTPLLCIQKTDHHLIPMGYNGPNNVLNNVIFNYVPGSSEIYLKYYDEIGYTGTDGVNLPIDALKVAHHYDKLLYKTALKTTSLKLNESADYIIKWHENKNNNTFSNSVINIKEKYPNAQFYKINLSNFIKCGDSIRINTYDYKIENNQIYLEKPYNLKDIDILYENDKCSLKFNDVNKTEDLGKIIDNKIVFSGDWGFTPKYYEGNHIENIEHKWNVNPFSIFEMNKTIIVEFIGAVILLSGICTYTIGLNYTDWAVIIFVIGLILIIW
ncbi:MAG: hypothetical protein MJY54_00065 [archaeon]|nr:hypothetical protein [archaeon]